MKQRFNDEITSVLPKAQIVRHLSWQKFLDPLVIKVTKCGPAALMTIFCKNDF